MQQNFWKMTDRNVQLPFPTLGSSRMAFRCVNMSRISSILYQFHLKICISFIYPFEYQVKKILKRFPYDLLLGMGTNLYKKDSERNISFLKKKMVLLKYTMEYIKRGNFILSCTCDITRSAWGNIKTWVWVLHTTSTKWL